jgi:hypothetical protein
MDLFCVFCGDCSSEDWDFCPNCPDYDADELKRGAVDLFRIGLIDAKASTHGK